MLKSKEPTNNPPRALEELAHSPLTRHPLVDADVLDVLQARFRAFPRASAHLLAAAEEQLDPREMHEALQRPRQGLHARVAHLLAAVEPQLDPREREREKIAFSRFRVCDRPSILDN